MSVVPPKLPALIESLSYHVEHRYSTAWQVNAQIGCIDGRMESSVSLPALRTRCDKHEGSGFEFKITDKACM